MAKLLSSDEAVAKISLVFQLSSSKGGIRPLYGPAETRYEIANAVVQSEWVPERLRGQPDLLARLLNWTRDDLNRIARGRRPGTRLRF